MKRWIIVASLLILTLTLLGQSAPEVVAEVNGEEITAEDIRAGGKMDMDENMMRLSSGEQVFERERDISSGEAERLLETAVDHALLLDEAASAGLEENPTFQEKLAAMKKQLLIQTYYQEVLLPEAEPTEEEMRAEYENSDRYWRPARAEVITRWAQNEQEANEMKGKLASMEAGTSEDGENRGEEIELLREEEMEKFQGEGSDGTNQRQNDPYFQLRVALVDASPGDIVGPFGKEDREYIVAKVIEKYEAGKPPFEEVRERIKEDMTRRNFREVVEKKRQELRKKATVTIYYENLNESFSE